MTSKLVYDITDEERESIEVKGFAYLRSLEAHRMVKDFVKSGLDIARVEFDKDDTATMATKRQRFKNVIAQEGYGFHGNNYERDIDVIVRKGQMYLVSNRR